MYIILYLNLRFEFKASGYCAAKSISAGFDEGGSYL